MKEILDKLHEIGEKAEYLHQRTHALAVENKALHERIAELEGKSAQQKSEIEDLGRQLEIAKFAKEMNQGDLESGEALKNKINEYIREIDQCLKLIGD